MITVAISKFRDNLQLYLSKIHKGDKILLTSHGKGVALVSSPETESDSAKKKLLELSRTSVIGDIISHIDEEWKSNK